MANQFSIDPATVVESMKGAHLRANSLPGDNAAVSIVAAAENSANSDRPTGDVGGCGGGGCMAVAGEQ